MASVSGREFVRSTDKASEEYIEYVCTPCTAEDRNSEAVTFCEDCGEYLCRECLKHHNKFAAMRSHRILDVGNISGQGPQPAKMVVMEKCERHNGNPIDTYCGNHDAVCCPTCVSLEHRSCTDMAFILDAARGVKKTQEYKGIKNAIGYVQLQLEQLQKTKQHTKKKLEREKAKCLTQIQDARTQINKHLDNLEKVARNKVQTKYKEYEDRVNKDSKGLEHMISTLEASIDQVEKANSDNEPQIFVRVKMGKQNQIDGRKLLQENLMQASHKTEKPDFKINSNIEDFVRNVKSFGDFTQEDSDNHVYSASTLSTHDVRVKGDGTCSVQGACQLQNGILLITDYRNKSLKRLGQSYKVLDRCKMPDSPACVCTTGPVEAAVTLPALMKIQFVSLGQPMSLTRSFNIGEWCRDVAYSNGELFVACGGGNSGKGPGQVRTYNTAGQLLRAVQNDAAGQQMFSCPIHIAVSTDGTLIYVTDEDNGVITLDRKGNKHSQFSNPDLKDASGVCLGANDQLFVSGWKSNNIIHVSQGGKKHAVLLGEKDGLKMPESLLYDRSNTRLIVTMQRNNHIAVFNLTRQ